MGNLFSLWYVAVDICLRVLSKTEPKIYIFVGERKRRRERERDRERTGARGKTYIKESIGGGKFSSTFKVLDGVRIELT